MDSAMTREEWLIAKFGPARVIRDPNAPAVERAAAPTSFILDKRLEPRGPNKRLVGLGAYHLANLHRCLLADAVRREDAAPPVFVSLHPELDRVTPRDGVNPAKVVAWTAWILMAGLCVLAYYGIA